MLVAAAASSCSSLPDAHYPPFVEHEIDASFLVDETGELPFPATTRDIVVRSLQLDPTPTGERFDDSGQRFFLYPPGSAVTARCQVRIYAGRDGTQRTVADLLPLALRIAPTP